MAVDAVDRAVHNGPGLCSWPFDAPGKGHFQHSHEDGELEWG